VCIRALPGDSLEYFGETVDGNTASLLAPGSGVAAGGVTAVVAGRVGVDGVAVGAAAGTFVGAAEASAPHSAFRKSFHFIPFSVLAFCAALYFALHSVIVRAYAVETCAANIAATNVPAQIVAERTSIKSSLTDVLQTKGIIARHDSRVHLIAYFSRTPFEANTPFETKRSPVRAVVGSDGFIK
jgi:hypothetical protein